MKRGTPNFRAVGSRRAAQGATIGSTVSIHGVECKVVTDEVAESADIVVCTDATVPLYFSDNLTGPCADCGQILQWRPHAPKKPPRVCVTCAAARIGR